GSPQTPALGAAIAAAVTAGTFATFEAAQDRMTSFKAQAYHPDPQRQGVYDELYAIYRELHDVFGPPSVEESRELGRTGGRPLPNLSTLMKRLLALRDRVVSGQVSVGAEMAGA